MVATYSLNVPFLLAIAITLAWKQYTDKFHSNFDMKIQPA